MISIRSILSLLLVTTAARGAMLDFSKALVVSPATLSTPEQKAVTMLIEEVAKRTHVRWDRSMTWPSNDTPVVALGPSSALKEFSGKYFNELSSEPSFSAAEGYRIRIKRGSGAPVVFVIGNDARGVLFGGGHLLRTLRMNPQRITLPDDVNVTTAPAYRLRGHQLGYRPKTHSYDAWDVPVWEQYYRDLVVFGCNAVELIPPRSDDASDSPHFPRPPMEMMVEMSRLADEYALDVWIWYPAMDKDYSDANTVEFALKEWSEVFKKLPRIDAVFVPGGDPGHTQPKHLMALLAKQTQNLRRFHPKAQMWVSPQSFNQQWLEEFFDILKTEQPVWLNGVVFGPQVRISLPQLRAAVPARYPIRHYPDITHSRQCQYPVPDWDVAFAVTEGRECINPRPAGQASIFRLLQSYTIGFLTYSEGCNDDVNKAIWSALGWNPDAKVIDVLREYSRYFIGERYTDDFAQGLLALERNWQGSLLANQGVPATLAQFQSMEKSAAPGDRANWRFQQALFRAYYDAYTRSRLLYETELEERALEHLRQARSVGALPAMSDAEEILERVVAQRVSADWRARIFELAEALYQTIRMQLSVQRHQAIAVDRGASLDTVDSPLNNRPWLKEKFRAIRKLTSEAERLKAIDEIVQWENPGPGGFYDDLGNPGRHPHLVTGPGFERDPAFLESAHGGFQGGAASSETDNERRPVLRKSWIDHAESMNDAPLQLHYENLDPQVRYKVRVVYAGDSLQRKLRLMADDGVEIHPLIQKPWPIALIEFDIPTKATEDGDLNLRWFREPGLGGNGRGCQVSEVWLMKK